MGVEVRRRLAYARAWLPRMPGDYLASRRIRLPGGYRRVYHHHVPKTGGTSLHRSFLALGGEDPAVVHERAFETPSATRSGPYVYVTRDPRALARGHYFFGWSHEPAWFVHLPSKTFTVTVLRDPAERVLSLYRYLCDERADTGLPVPADHHARSFTQDGFVTFLDRFPRNELHKQLDLFSRGHDPREAAQMVRGCSLYFFNESYTQGMEALSRRLDLPLEVRRDRVSVGEARPSPSEMDVLYTRLEGEYEMLDELRKDPGPGLVGEVPRSP